MSSTTPNDLPAISEQHTQGTQLPSEEDLVESDVLVRLTFEGGEAIMCLENNAAARAFAEQLPLTQAFEDFNSIEKICRLPEDVATEGVKTGVDPDIADVTLYVPWNTLVFHYDDYSYNDELISIGYVESGMEMLAGMGDEFSVTIELLENDAEGGSEMEQATEHTEITMTVGDTVITAALDNSETTQAFLASLPRTLTMNQYSNREYYGRIEAISENGEAITDFENGDVTYYPAGPSFAVFFAKADSSNQSGLSGWAKSPRTCLFLTPWEKLWRCGSKYLLPPNEGIPMTVKRKVQLLLDLAMTVLLLPLMAYSLVGEIAHEWLGTIMYILFLGHHALNMRWYNGLTMGRWNAARCLQTAVNFALFLIMVGLMVSGVTLSRQVFAFLPISGGTSWARTLHMVCSYWGFCLMSLHIGMHWGIVIGRFQQRAGSNFRRSAILLRVTAVLIAGYGTYAFHCRGIATYMFLKTAFVFFDYEEPLVLFLRDYLAVMGLFTAVGYYTVKLLRRLKQNAFVDERGRS